MLVYPLAPLIQIEFQRIRPALCFLAKVRHYLDKTFRRPVVGNIEDPGLPAPLCAHDQRVFDTIRAPAAKPSFSKSRRPIRCAPKPFLDPSIVVLPLG